MGGSGAIIHMIKSAQANRRLQQKNRQRRSGRLNDLNQNTKVRKTKQFNELFLDETRPAVIENRKRLATEIEEIRKQDTLKTVISVVLSLAFFLVWLEKCWY